MKALLAGLRALWRGRSGATPQRQLATRKAVTALLAALACIVLALALGEDETAAPDPPRPWEALPASESALAPLLPPRPEPPLAAPPTEAVVPVPAASASSDFLAPLAAAPAAPVNAYRVQLGVFADPANALALLQRLQTQGLPAGVQSRIVLGPFPDQKAARQAQATLRAAGMEEGMLLLPDKAAGNKAASNKAKPD